LTGIWVATISAFTDGDAARLAGWLVMT
jgi:hypothetical protein